MVDGKILNNKVVRARCWGLPVSLWNEECIRKIVSTDGKFISIDQNSISIINLEYLKVQMTTSLGHKIDFIQDVKINGTIYHVVVWDEMI